MDHIDHIIAPAVLFLRMEPSWTVIDDIRNFVESFCANACPHAEREEHLALATHELVQNAIANAATPDIELKLELDKAAERVSLAVSNSARDDQIEVLRRRLEKMKSYPNPLDGYVAAMREDPDSRGGIGLARVRYEAALDLALEVEGEKVTIRAAGPLMVPEAAQLA